MWFGGVYSLPFSSFKIHALNVLRVLFKDARLGEDVIPYIADGVKAAILGFAAQLGAVSIL